MSFVVKGLDSVMEGFAHAAVLPDAVYDKMLFSAADVMVKEVASSANAHLQGPYTTGDLVENIKHGKIRKSSKGSRFTDVIFAGRVVDKHHPKGERRAKIAFINEYGKHGQPARPFIRLAIESGTVKALNAAADIYYEEINDYL